MVYYIVLFAAAALLLGWLEADYRKNKKFSSVVFKKYKDINQDSKRHEVHSGKKQYMCLLEIPNKPGMEKFFPKESLGVHSSIVFIYNFWLKDDSGKLPVTAHWVFPAELAGVKMREDAAAYLYSQHIRPALEKEQKEKKAKKFLETYASKAYDL